jgi:DNA-binding Lrp family transcriptional regulator/energy-coupling factor transporter ATP-binding protein EcfA2
MFNEFIQWLQSQGVPLRPTNNGYLVRCPVHPDDQPSLSIAEGNNGRVLLYCFAQCDYRTIADAFVQQGANPAWFGLSPRVTLSDLAQGDRQLLATLQALGCTEQGDKVGFPVTYADGSQGYHFRIALDGKGKWKHQSGGKASEAVFALHGERVQQAIARCQAVIVTESPLDAATLLAASKWTNLPAISVLGKGNAKALSADWHRQALSDAIGDGGTIFVWVEPDANGFAQAVADALQRPVKAISAPDAERKDAYRLWLALNKDWNAFAQAIHDLAAQATEVTPQQSTLSDAPQDGNAPPRERPTCPFCQLSDAELFDLARPVLDAENPVADAAKRLCDAANIVAEDENAQLLLLIATTRILPNPVHALVVGTTGAGKSALVNAVSAAIPPCHRRTLVGTSARALLVHPLKPATLLNWLELPNLDSESIASTILRALLWQDGSDSADYLLTEWVGGRAKARTLKLPRQIALLSTRVDLPKDEQLVTRLFIVEVKETPEKRQSVLSAIARQWQDSERPDPDALRQPVVAFMEWAQRRTWRVVIPFADALMALLSQLPPAERDYRDAANLLRLIAASAIWHLSQRQHALSDEGVTVVADLDDYALVRQLVAPAFAKTRAFALSEGERQIVDALRLGDTPMTAKELAERLGLSDAAVRMRLQALKKKGVVSDESVDSKRKAWRLEGTPTMTDFLPTVEALKARWQPEPPDPTPEADAKMRRDAKEAPPSHFSPIKQGTFGDAKMRRSDLNRGQNPPYLKADDFNQPDSQCFTREKHCPSANVIETAFAPSDAQKRKENKAENAKGSSPSHSFASSDVPSEGDLEVKVVCPRCGAWKRIPPDTLMLADPRCPVCGEVMCPDPEGSAPTVEDREDNLSSRRDSDATAKAVAEATGVGDAPPLTDPAPLTVTDLETGEPLVVGTDAWLEATFGTACPDCGTTLTDGTCPTCGYPDDRPQWRIGRLVMAIAKALRSRHPQCRSAPCDACRQVVARMNRAVVANDWQGLIALWREVTADGDAEVSP